MRKVTLIPGDGVGPEITQAVIDILAAAGADIEWEYMAAGQGAYERQGHPLPESTLASIRTNGVALKGPLSTAVASGFRSINVSLRKEFDLYCNLRPVRNLPAVRSRFDNVDIVIFRENTEDLYAGIEHKIGDVAAESIKLITAAASTRIAEAAFEYAVKNNRQLVTAVHKANIMKYSDGLFLECARRVAARYPGIAYREIIVDNACMQLVMRPEQFDVLLAPNLYGDIISDLCAGLVGGLGFAPSANIGASCAIFEAVHGTAPDIAGKNAANPLALLMSAILMLKHIGMVSSAKRIEAAMYQVLKRGDALTADMGGSSSTTDMTNAIIEQLNFIA